jgi:dTDP-4-amino-4,6-dideoxygalactose transaminase
LPANTYSATAIAITNIGAIPVFADINLDNFTIDIWDIESKITSRTKAIIPVHLY